MKNGVKDNTYYFKLKIIFFYYYITLHNVINYKVFRLYKCHLLRYKKMEFSHEKYFLTKIYF